MRGGSDKSGGPGSSGGHGRGSTESFRGGARSPGLPSPNTLLLRSLSSSSAISRVSSHFSHFNSNAAPVELQLPVSFRRRGNSADGEEAVRAFGGGAAGDGRDSSGTLDARAARAKYLPSAGAGGGAGAGAAAAESAARAAKGKSQWGWGAGKSIFGKRAPVVEVKRSGNTEPEAPPDPSTSVTTISAKPTTLAAAAVEAAHATRKAAGVETQQGGRRLPGETGGTYREPGGERGRGTRSAAEQRSRLERDGRREVGEAVVRVRDSRRPRQSRSVDSPGKVAKGVPATADAAIEAAQSFFSVPAVSHGDSREGGAGGGGKLLHRQRQRSASTENEEGARYERRENNSDRDHRFGGSSSEKRTAAAAADGHGHRGKERADARQRRSPAPAGTRRERESSRRPSRAIGRTRTRSEERLSRRGEGKQWSDMANPRPPLPHPSPAPEAGGALAGGSLSRRTGGGSGGISAASPANSSGATSDDKSRASRGMDDNSSSAGWGTSSLAGWGETMAAEAEAEVLGRSHRAGERHGDASKGDNTDDGVVDKTLREQPERTRLHQMVAALTDLCMYLVGVSPLSMEECPTMLEHLPNDDDDDWDEVRVCFVACICVRNLASVAVVSCGLCLTRQDKTRGATVCLRAPQEGKIHRRRRTKSSFYWAVVPKV